MKKKEAGKLVLGDQLVMVRDGSYGACFKEGDKVSFQWHQNSQMFKVLGLLEGRELHQTINRKDVELYVEPAQTPLPHAELRKTYKQGQEWEFKMPFSEDWHDCDRLNKPTEPLWHEGREYRLKSQKPVARNL